MSQVTSPIILDSTGQDIVTQLTAISAAIAAGSVITANTQTNLNGVLSGNGTTVGVKAVDAAPTADSGNLVSSGGVKAALDKEVIVVNIPAFSSLPQTVSNAAIKADHVVIDSTLGTPGAQTGDWTVTTANGSLTISGNISGSTTLKLVLGLAGMTI